MDVDLASQTLTLPNGEKVSFPVDSFAKHCLLNGVDQLPLRLQLRLLEALRSGRTERVGADESTPFDVRLISATVSEPISPANMPAMWDASTECLRTFCPYEVR